MATFNVNTDLVNGDEVMLYIFTGSTAPTSATAFSADTEVVAFATSCSLNIDGATIDTSNKMSCRWNSNLAGKNSYTVSADALYTDVNGTYNFDDLLAAMIDGDPIYWAMGEPAASTASCETNTFELDTTKVIAWGAGLITSLSLTAGNNEVASASVTITGSGDLHTA